METSLCGQRLGLEKKKVRHKCGECGGGDNRNVHSEDASLKWVSRLCGCCDFNQLK